MISWHVIFMCGWRVSEFFAFDPQALVLGTTDKSSVSHRVTLDQSLLHAQDERQEGTAYMVCL